MWKLLMINGIKETYQIVKEALMAWKHGFKTKTGAEPWLVTHYKKELLETLVNELKKEMRKNR